MKVGLTAICKNNEAIIVRMLASAVKHVQEVILVDTGSTDNTKVVASEFLQANKIPFLIIDYIEAPFHFANARNKGIDALDPYCDFILSLDTDDVLPDTWQWPDFKADVYSFHYPYQVMRLWRTKKGIKYVNRIHEVIQWDTSCVFEKNNQAIIHLQSDNRDPERNIRLLKIEDSSLRTLFYIGNEYADLKKFEQAVIYYRHYINRCKFEPHWQEELMCAIWRCARYLERLGRVEESTKITSDGLLINSGYAELWRQMAWNHRADKVAYTRYTLAANSCPLFPHLFSEDHMYRIQGFNILRPGANGDLLMLSAATSQLKHCILYTSCKEIGAKLEGVIEVKDPSEWDSRNPIYLDWLPNYPRSDLKEPIIKTFCDQLGLPVGPMRLKS